MNKPREKSLWRWAILPLNLIFAAVAFRISWHITGDITPLQILWWLAILATICAYCLLLRLMLRATPAKLPAATWARAVISAGVATALVIATVYLSRHITTSVTTVSQVVLAMAFAVNISGYFVLAMLSRPYLASRLPTRLVRLVISIMMTVALIGLAIHTTRFLPSPEAAAMRSQVMAILLLASLATAHPLLLSYFWSVWRHETARLP